MAFWEGGELVLQNYLTNKRTAVAPQVLRLLHEMEGYAPKGSVVEALSPVPGAAGIVERLLAQDVLLAEGSPPDRKERALDARWKWGHEARFFHYSTQHVDYEADPEAQREGLVRLARRDPPPPPFKDCVGARVRLPGSFEDRTGDAFWEALRARRTCRSFLRREIPLEDFSALLLWTWGKTRLVTDPEVGQHVLKTSPSGGARHPTEVYPVVLRVRGVKAGVYHYSVRRHDLELLRPGLFEEMVVRLCAGQAWLRDASAVFFMTAVVGRNMWKYDHPRAYRVLQLETGHLGQTFHLVCARLGLAPFTTAATLDADIETELGLDGVTETPTYAAAVGIPAQALPDHPPRPPLG